MNASGVKNIQHRTLNIERPMKNKPPYLFPLNIRCWKFDVRCSSFQSGFASGCSGVRQVAPAGRNLTYQVYLSQSARRSQRKDNFFIAGEGPAMKNRLGAVAHPGRRPEVLWKIGLSPIFHKNFSFLCDLRELERSGRETKIAWSSSREGTRPPK